MSTNKSQNYQLHSWEPEDDFLRAEFNENFAKLDQVIKGLDIAKPEFLFGSYTGAYDNSVGTKSHITLGRKPKAVILMRNCGNPSSGRSYSALFAVGYPCTAAEIDSTGFSVWNTSGTNGAYLNNVTYTYYYLALV